MVKDILRVCRFSPYAKGAGPVFRLTVWDAHRTDSYGKSVLGYRLSMGEKRHLNVVNNPAVWTVLFEGDDFHCSTLHCIDSDETVAGIMAFLTLRPGDTGKEYFQDYTAEQLEYCSHHAEALSCEVQARFGID